MGAPDLTAQTSAEPVPTELTYAGVFAVSFPIIISNVTTPLLGITHTAVVGQLGESHLIGATQTRDMRNMMIVSFAVFLGS